MVDINGTEYEISDSIGKGMYGTVYKGTVGDNVYAIKKMNIISDGEMQTSTMRETTILQHLNHPNIVKVVDIGRVDNDIYVVMPYIGSTLEYKIFDRHEVRSIMWQLFLALKHMEDRGVMHRDIKAANIVMNDIPVIIDFSIACMQPRSDFTNVVTATYKTPELYRDIEYDIRVDVWSMGVIMYNILAGKPLFQYGGTDRKYLGNVLSAYTDGNDWWDTYGGDTIFHTVQIRDGPYLSDILDHHRVDDVEKDLILSILQLHYQDIPSISTVMSHPYFDGLKAPSPTQSYSFTDLPTYLYLQYRKLKETTIYDHITIMWACLYLTSNSLLKCSIARYKKVDTDLLRRCALDIYDTIHYNLLPP